MKILLTGANGQLGTELQRLVPGDVQLLALSSQQLDITNAAQVQALMQQHQPAVVINAAAYTQVDKAESESERAWAVNQQGVANLVSATGANTRLLHISTDFVFDGRSQTPYATTATPNPLSVYGKSKWAGEQVLLAKAPQRSCIVRTAWLYSAGSKNFLNTMLQLLENRDSVRVVNDQRGTPTSAASLAEALWRVVQKPQVQGILHWTDAGETTWYGFACEIQRLGLKHGLLSKQVPIQPITTSEYPTPAQRPAYSVLEKEGTFAALGLRALSWQESLEKVIRQRADEQRNR